MLTMGLDIGSRSTQCAILEDGQLLTSGNVETGPDSAGSAYAAVDAAVHQHPSVAAAPGTGHLGIEDMDCIVATGYGRVVVPFADATLTEISCHGRGAHWMVPGASTVLDMGGQDCKGIRVNERGDVIDFIMNDRCAGGTGRFIEIIAGVLKVPLSEVGELSLGSTERISFSTVCAVLAKSQAVAFMRQGASKADILAGLHEAIAERVLSLLSRVGIADVFVITGGIGKNAGVVAKIRDRLGGMEVVVPEEPQIAGAVGAALFALDRASRHHHHHVGESDREAGSR